MTPHSHTNRTAASADFPLSDADRCVKCGLCLPHCPTYQLSQHEGDSPRGRIALMQGLATGLIPAGERLEAHLDGCLACRACEAVCPADVPYGRLIDAGRATLARHRPARTRLTRWMGWVLAHRRLRTGLGWLLWLYQACKLQAAVRRWRLLCGGALARLESLLPPMTRPHSWPSVYPAVGECHGKVALFVGCVSELAERQVLDDTITLLTRLGYAVTIPRTQTCCGALHLHNGLPDSARALARKNIGGFAGEYAAILGTSSGCTASLAEYHELLPGAETFTAKVQDICQFLVNARGWDRLHFSPLPQTVSVHEPCTLRNVLKGAAAAYALLGKVPQLKVQALAGNARCCGAAGSYFLTQATHADALGQTKLEAVKEASPEWLVSSNVGCALQIGGTLRRHGISLPVLHPVSLLVRQLVPPGSTSVLRQFSTG